MASEKRFAVVRWFLEGAGFKWDRTHGSHFIFTKPGTDGISVPVHKGKVKPAYVRQIEKIVGKRIP